MQKLPKCLIAYGKDAPAKEGALLWAQSSPQDVQLNVEKEKSGLHLEPVEVFAQAYLPTQYGDFRIYAFCRGSERLEDVALVRGSVANKVEVPTRLHSECVTGDVFHSLRCDCRQQLESALKQFAALDEAVILYMRQEGRGIGLANKIAAYKLQEDGYDTVDANLHLGYDDDLRSYDVAAAMLKCLELRSVELYTNNPNKIEGLERCGLKVTRRQPIVVSPNIYNERYLKTKQQKSGHIFES